jgi:hypothetical protein
MQVATTVGCLLIGAVEPQAQTTYRPTPQLGDILGLRFFPQSGLFQFDGVQLAFPDDKAGYAFVLRRAGGAVVYQTGLRFEPVSGFPAFAALTPLERGSDKFKLTEGGSYEFAVRAGEQDLTVVPFQAAAAGSGDPFKPGQTFRLTGLWDKVAYLYGKDGDASAQLRAVGWLADHELGPAREDKFVVVQIAQGANVLCKSTVFIDAPHWGRFRFDLARPSNNAPCTFADLQKTDGTYRLEFRSKSRVLRSYTITVTGGQIQRTARNSLAYMQTRSDGIPPKFVNTDLEMQEAYWFEVAR